MNGDLKILNLIESGRILVNADAGLVFAPKSNTPKKAIGAKTKKGYLRACITVDGKQLHFMVHRIVWVSVHGQIPNGYQIDHLDTNKTNNAISNLEAVTGPTNICRARDAGLYRVNGRRDGLRDSKGRFGKKHDGMPVSETVNP